ncbi:phage tail assembly chaperone [Bacillus sp. MCCB 382]|nr:phage tail assembly chaperone [Bacillus sp. MCCB 382]
MTQAFGYLDLHPEQFWDTTPREFRNMMDGFKLRQDIEWQRTAQLASWVISAHVKKPPSADKLLGKDKDGKQRSRKVVSIEEKRATLADLESTLGRTVSKHG